MKAPSILAFAVFLFGLFPAAARAEAPFAFDRTPGKLPKTVVPLEYDIALRPDVRALTFTGHERVTVRVRASTSAIVLNSLNLTISRATLDGRPVADIATDNTKQLTTLKLSSSVAAGMHAVALSFAGKLGDQPQGLFYQKFGTPTGERVMLATQMESTDARRMFPGWDEPSFRASYRMTVTVPKNFDAVSNMPATSEVTSGDVKTVTFARTPKMASYLVVLCAGEFRYVRGSSDGVAVRVVAPKGREQNGRYALDAAEKLLAYYDQYFGTKYPLPKLDLIAVPGGFPGAMENWGGITFTQDSLLFDASVEPESAKEQIFQTIAHEMSHQWFGDLVTMGWWDNLWLNEGFADWMQTKATDHFNPQWHLWQRVNGDVETAMATDGQTTTHPVQTPIADETQAGAAFDEITYQKGGAFIRMMEEYLGEDTFRDGIRRYMQANAYSNTTSANLYASLSTASHQDVAAFAGPWTLEPGFPLVSVDESCVNGQASLSVSQRRFFYEPNQSSQQLWQIPLSIAGAVHSATAHTVLMTKQAETLTGGPCGEPVLVNAGAAGYFRVQYDTATANALIANLEHMAPADRVRIIADTSAQVTAGLTPPSAYLQTLAALGADDNLAVWETVTAGIDGIANLEAGRPGQTAFDAYRRQLLSPIFQRIGWSGSESDPSVQSLRSRLIGVLGSAGDPQVIAESRARFAKFRSDPSSLPPDLRGSVLTVVGTHADAATWEQLHALVKTAKNLEEAQVYQTALWGARDPQLAQKNLQMAVDGEIPPEAGPISALIDVATVATLGRQPKLAWEFFKTNAPTMITHLSAFEKGLLGAKFIPVFWNAAPPSELEAFAKTIMPPGTAPQLAQAMHQVDLQVATSQRVLPEVDQWVAAHHSGSTAGR